MPPAHKFPVIRIKLPADMAGGFLRGRVCGGQERFAALDEERGASAFWPEIVCRNYTPGRMFSTGPIFIMCAEAVDILRFYHV